MCDLESQSLMWFHPPSKFSLNHLVNILSASFALYTYIRACVNMGGGWGVYVVVFSILTVLSLLLIFFPLTAFYLEAFLPLQLKFRLTQ